MSDFYSRQYMYIHVCIVCPSQRKLTNWKVLRQMWFVSEISYPSLHIDQWLNVHILFYLRGYSMRSPNLKAKHSHWYPMHPYKTYTIGANVLPCMLNMYKLIQFTLFEIMYCISVQYAYFFPVLFFTYERSSTPTEYC